MPTGTCPARRGRARVLPTVDMSCLRGHVLPVGNVPVSCPRHRVLPPPQPRTPEAWTPRPGRVRAHGAPRRCPCPRPRDGSAPVYEPQLRVPAAPDPPRAEPGAPGTGTPGGFRPRLGSPWPRPAQYLPCPVPAGPGRAGSRRRRRRSRSRSRGRAAAAPERSGAGRGARPGPSLAGTAHAPTDGDHATPLAPPPTAPQKCAQHSPLHAPITPSPPPGLTAPPKVITPHAPPPQRPPSILPTYPENADSSSSSAAPQYTPAPPKHPPPCDPHTPPTCSGSPGPGLPASRHRSSGFAGARSASDPLRPPPRPQKSPAVAPVPPAAAKPWPYVPGWGASGGAGGSPPRPRKRRCPPAGAGRGGDTQPGTPYLRGAKQRPGAGVGGPVGSSEGVLPPHAPPLPPPRRRPQTKPLRRVLPPPPPRLGSAEGQSRSAWLPPQGAILPAGHCHWQPPSTPSPSNLLGHTHGFGARSHTVPKDGDSPNPLTPAGPPRCHLGGPPRCHPRARSLATAPCYGERRDAPGGPGGGGGMCRGAGAAGAGSSWRGGAALAAAACGNRGAGGAGGFPAPHPRVPPGRAVTLRPRRWRWVGAEDIFSRAQSLPSRPRCHRRGLLPPPPPLSPTRPPPQARGVSTETAEEAQQPPRTPRASGCPRGSPSWCPLPPSKPPPSRAPPLCRPVPGGFHEPREPHEPGDSLESGDSQESGGGFPNTSRSPGAEGGVPLPLGPPPPKYTHLQPAPGLRCPRALPPLTMARRRHVWRRARIPGRSRWHNRGPGVTLDTGPAVPPSPSRPPRASVSPARRRRLRAAMRRRCYSAHTRSRAYPPRFPPGASQGLPVLPGASRCFPGPPGASWPPQR
ncbi:basic proline-rich protein-like [Pithys albifrons albifrons]|uniref:basic proline-rich protein-like n=1 Tax=Pithys albifrons albifrons TaxID=3385563 RepID=UPI003A5CDFFB